MDIAPALWMKLERHTSNICVISARNKENLRPLQGKVIEARPVSWDEGDSGVWKVFLRQLSSEG